MGTEAEAPDDEATTEVDAATGHALAAFLPRVAAWVVIVTIEVVTDPDPALTLMLLALAGVATIVTDSRFAWERRLEDHGVPSREAWVPLLMLGLMLQLDLADLDNVSDVLVDKGPVILFILAFALVSEGLRRSGFIHFLAYRLADRGRSNTTRLTLYLFLLSSLLTYFTSNDIVVLTMTPIVVSVAYQARIRNAKLLLLSQFIAANTVSMGILIGSPTNLILGRAMDIRFAEYFFLMLAPSVMALMATFVFVTWMNWFVESRGTKGGRITRWLVGTWTYSPDYTSPRFSEYRTLTREMRQWVGVFMLSVALLTVGTATTVGLLVAAVLIAAIGLTSLRRSARRHDEPTGSAFFRQALRVLPFGIVFFGLTYFVLADAIADTRFVREEVDDFVTENASDHTPIPSWGAMLASGGLVNTMNDLPASALTGAVLERAEFETPFDRALVVQGSAAGLNIATYVTPVGALAGIIWFDILRKERQRRSAMVLATGRQPFDVVMPQRRDLVIYGSVMFLATTAVLGATNFGFVALADALLGPPEGGSVFGAASSHMGWMFACLAVAFAVVVAFRRVLAAAGVVLAHLGDVLVVVTQVRLWASRHRMLAAVWFAGVLFTCTGALLYWAETFHAREYNRAPLFDDPGEFMTWLTVFVSSGFENEKFPRSTLGHILSALLALGSIAALVVLLRLSTGSTDLNLRRKLARGEIPSDRLVIVNCAADNLRLVRTLVAGSRRFVTITSRDALLETRFGLRKNDRVDVITHDEGSPADLVSDLHLDEARELVLLSRSVSDDFDNLALLTALDRRKAEKLPGILLQMYERELPSLLDTRLGEQLRAHLARAPFDQVVRAFLVADAAGAVGDLRRLYTEPLLGREARLELDADIRLRGVGFAAPLDTDRGGGPRRTVRVVGGGSFAQACAVDLVRSGVEDVQLVVGSEEPLLPSAADAPGVSVQRCDNERIAAEALAASAGSAALAILVVDGAGDRGLDIERLLERLSIARLHEIDAGRPVPRLLVACRGAERARRVGNFVVDKVVDTTWVESSYFAVFGSLYFDVLLADEDVADWDAVRQLGVAHRIASLLCHLDVATSDSLASEPLGTVEFGVERADDGARPVVAVDLKVPVVDERIEPSGLVVGAAYR